MIVRKFKYRKDGTISEREVIVVREPIVKGKGYLEGFCLSSMSDERQKSELRDAAPFMTVGPDDQIFLAYKAEENEQGLPTKKDLPDIKAAMSSWRIFSKEKIVG